MEKSTSLSQAASTTLYRLENLTKKNTLTNLKNGPTRSFWSKKMKQLREKIGQKTSHYLLFMNKVKFFLVNGGAQDAITEDSRPIALAKILPKTKYASFVVLNAKNVVGAYIYILMTFQEVLKERSQDGTNRK